MLDKSEEHGFWMRSFGKLLSSDLGSETRSVIYIDSAYIERMNDLSKYLQQRTDCVLWIWFGVVCFKTCKECGESISLCPLCREPINTRLKLYS